MTFQNSTTSDLLCPATLKECPRVLIIGAGIAGIASGDYLSRAGITDFKILEAQNRTGGRIWSIDVDDKGSKAELGANWIHGIERNPIYEIAYKNHLLKLRNENKDFRGRHLFLTEHDCEQVSEKMVKEVDWVYGMLIQKTGDFYQNGIQTPEINDSVGTFLEREIKEKLQKYNNSDRQLRKMIFKHRMLLECTMNGCDNLHELSLSDIGVYEELPGIHYTIPPGFETVLEILKENIPEENILLDHQVKKIIWNPTDICQDSAESDNFEVCVECGNGSKFYANHVLITVSLGVLKSWVEKVFDPPLPLERTKLINRMGYGVIDKVMLEFDEQVIDSDVFRIEMLWDSEPDWKEEEYLKEKWYRKIYSFTVIHKNVILGWLSGKAATYMETLSEEEIGQELCKVLRHFLKKDDIPLPKRVIKTCWSTNPYTQGAYSYISLGSCADDIDALAEPLYPDAASKPTVLFAGEATHRSYYSTTHGALLTGQREAQRIISMYSDQSEDSADTEDSDDDAMSFRIG